MRKRNLTLAVATVWVSLLLVPNPSLGERIPTKPLEPLDGSPGGGHGSDPWVPDGSLPTGAALHAPNVHSGESPESPRVSGLTQKQKVNQVRVQWYLRLLRLLRSFPGGAVR